VRRLRRVHRPELGRRESSLVFLLRQVDPGRLPFGSLEPVEITQVLVRTQPLGLGHSGFVVVTAPVEDVGDVAQVTVVEGVSPSRS
jgi:hypothetical protein